MKPRTTLLTILAALLAASGPAAAHEGSHSEHLSITIDTLEPGANATYHLAFEGGDFEAGWLFLIYGGINTGGGHALDVALLTGAGEAVEAWRWTPGPFGHNLTILPETSEYVLELTNPSDEPVDFAFYYDQSCNCLSKMIGIDKGLALFNFDFKAGQHATMAFKVQHYDTQSGAFADDPNIHVRGSVATLTTDSPAKWPDDFEVLTQVDDLADGTPLEWDADEAGRYYIVAEVIQGALPQRPVYMEPTLQVDEGPQPDQAAPAPGLLIVFVALAALVLASRRRS